MAEAEAAVTVIDDYAVRFRRLRDSQAAWVRARALKIPLYCPICNGQCEFGPETPEAPHRVPAEALTAARNKVTGNAVQLLMRLYDSGLIDKAELSRHVERLRLPLETEDLSEPRRSDRQ